MLLAENLSYKQIGQRLGVCKSTVAYHARRLGSDADDKPARRYPWAEIAAAYDGGLSRLQCAERFGFSSSSWTQAVRRGDITPRSTLIPLETLLVVGRRTNRTHLKLRLYGSGLKKDVCERCGLSEWRGAPLGLHLHHINGDGTDNRLENLEILCPNCHAQTENWAGRGRRTRPRRSRRP